VNSAGVRVLMGLKCHHGKVTSGETNWQGEMWGTSQLPAATAPMLCCAGVREGQPFTSLLFPLGSGDYKGAEVHARLLKQAVVPLHNHACRFGT
jgi:hypothetical protein